MQDGPLRGAVPTCPRHWVPSHSTDMQPFMFSWVCLPLPGCACILLGPRGCLPLPVHQLLWTHITSLTKRHSLQNFKATVDPVRYLVQRTGAVISWIGSKTVNMYSCPLHVMPSCFLCSSLREKNTFTRSTEAFHPASLSASKMEKKLPE